MILANTFREKLDQGLPTVGTHFMFSDPDIPEMIGNTGLFDYAEFTAEYSTFDMAGLYHMARSAQCGNLPLMIKLDQEGQGFWAQAALGAGFKSVLFTDIRTPDDVDRCHRVVSPDFPDADGAMGVKLRRPALGSYDMDDYVADLHSIVVVIMIEKDVAVSNIDAVLERAQARGVDMTQWRPADFGFSRGQPRMSATPEIREFEELVIRKSLEYGVAPRIEIADAGQAQRYVDLGVRHFCIGWDRFIYGAALKRMGDDMRELLASV